MFQYDILFHRFIETFNDTFTASLFSQFTTSLITICITAFEISIVSMFVKLFIYYQYARLFYYNFFDKI